MQVKTIRVGTVKFGGSAPLVLIAGPCVIEGRSKCLAIAGRLAEISRRFKIPLIFKASYDKANRSSATSFRGPGMAKGLAILAEIKERYHFPILTDVHAIDQVQPAAEVADILQLPAFLCRQTDLVVAMAESGRVVNVKKGQFLAPWDVKNIIAKIEETGNHQILLTERGASFGYNNLVADMRSLLVMRGFGYPVIFDATHSVQLPGGQGDTSGGESRWAPALARAAVATGCDGVFIETHPDPARALSDGPNMIPLAKLAKVWKTLRSIDAIVS